MTSNKYKIALVEIGGSHDECLFTQIQILKANKHTTLTLVCNDSLRKRVEIFKNIDNFHFITIRQGWSAWLDIYALRKYLLQQNFDKIIFNTAQGAAIKKLMLIFPKYKTQLIGTIHNIDKLEHSKGQQIISNKINKYFVINDYLLKRINLKHYPKLSFAAYYPIFFPKFIPRQLTKPTDEIWICIPGQVELKRRDYESLMEGIVQNGIPKHLKFILLGRCEHKHGDGIYIKHKIAELNIERQFMLWDSFIELDEFYSYLMYSDFILPLIHTTHISSQLYETQITGTYNLAFGFKKPLLMENQFSTYEDFKNNAIFYEKNNMISVISSLSKNMSTNIYKDDKWTFEDQKKRYWSLLEK